MLGFCCRLRRLVVPQCFEHAWHFLLTHCVLGFQQAVQMHFAESMAGLLAAVPDAGTEAVCMSQHKCAHDVTQKASPV